MQYVVGDAAISETVPKDYIGIEVEHFLKEQIIEVWQKYMVGKKKINREQKISFIDELYQKGIFRLRGGVSQISTITGFSVASIYRYLSEVIES